MNKVQYIKESEEIYSATKKAFYYDTIPVEMCLSQYAKSLKVLREVLEKNPAALNKKIVSSCRADINNRCEKENKNSNQFHDYVIEGKNEKWGISIYYDDSCYSAVVDEYIRDEDNLFRLRTMFDLGSKAKEISLLDCNFFIVSEQKESICIDVSIGTFIDQDVNKLPEDNTNELVKTLKSILVNKK